MRPVVATSGDHPSTAIVSMHRQAVAVPFHFEGPVRSFRRLGLEKSKARLDPIRHWIGEQITGIGSASRLYRRAA